MSDEREEPGYSTQKITTVKRLPQDSTELPVVETPFPPALPSVETPFPPALPKVVYKKVTTTPTPNTNKRDLANARILQDRCRQLCLSIFFRELAPARSLGFTSSIGGEGKSFLASTSARVLANDSFDPVILLECNWEHPWLHEHFKIPSTPGLAEWLRGECSAIEIRHQVDHNLTVIPAGNGRTDAVRLLQQIRQKGLLDTFAYSNELLVVDLPAIVTTAYGQLAASLVESLIMVVYAGVTPDSILAEACTQIKDLPVQGILLNQLESRIPGWIRQLL